MDLNGLHIAGHLIQHDFWFYQLTSFTTNKYPPG